MDAETVEETPQKAEDSAGDENATANAESSATLTEDNNADSPTAKRERSQPYINPDRVKTGGQRDKMTPEALTEKLEKMRLQNAAIKQRQQQVDADKQAFSQSVEIERQKASAQAEIQVKINRSREENARRKQERKENREWDVGKETTEWGQKPNHTSPTSDSRGRGRGRGSGRGRGRDERRHRVDETAPAES